MCIEGECVKDSRGIQDKCLFGDDYFKLSGSKRILSCSEALDHFKVKKIDPNSYCYRNKSGFATRCCNTCRSNY